MPEQHEMKVQWSGNSALGEALIAGAKEHGHEPTLQASEADIKFVITIVDEDLQSLRDRVNQLLVTLSALEEAHNG